MSNDQQQQHEMTPEQVEWLDADCPHWTKPDWLPRHRRECEICLAELFTHARQQGAEQERARIAKALDEIADKEWDRPGGSHDAARGLYAAADVLRQMNQPQGGDERVRCDRPPTLNQQLRGQREALGMTLKDVADAGIGVSVVEASDVERGRSSDPSYMFRMAMLYRREIIRRFGNLLPEWTPPQPQEGVSDGE